MRPLFLLALIAPTFASALDVTAQSATVIDGGSGKVLWQRDPDASRFPASTTKIMTALLLLEHCTPNQIVTSPADVNTVKESSMHLQPGERLKVRDLLYGIMLRSANDGCYAAAIHVAGSVPAFAKMMNDRAKAIGCTNTHFNNPNGLNDPQHYTTAHDLAAIAREAMKNPLFREIVRTWKIRIDRGSDSKDRWMINHDKLLAKDPTCEGIKTGWTVPAGRCFVGSVNRYGWRAISVVLKSKNWQEDTKHLVEWAFQQYAPRALVKTGDLVGSLTLTSGRSASINAVASQDASTVVRRGTTEPTLRSLEPNPGLSAPIKKGDVIGNLVLKDPDGFSQRIPVLAQEDVKLSPVAVVTKGRSNSYWIPAIFIAGAYFFRGRVRRKVKNARP